MSGPKWTVIRQSRRSLDYMAEVLGDYLYLTISKNLIDCLKIHWQTSTSLFRYFTLKWNSGFIWPWTSEYGITWGSHPKYWVYIIFSNKIILDCIISWGPFEFDEFDICRIPTILNFKSLELKTKYYPAKKSLTLDLF